MEARQGEICMNSRRHPDLVVAVMSLWGAACGRTEDPTAAAQAFCDGSDEVRLAYRASGGFVFDAYAFFGAYGLGYLAVDGGCHYWAADDGLSGLHTGTLGTEMAARVASDLHVAEIPALSAHPDTQSCPDAGEFVLASGGKSINCTCGCDDLPAAIPEAFKNAYPLRMNLAAAGAAFDGPLRALTVGNGQGPGFTPPPGSVFPWPLASSPTAFAAVARIGPDSGQPIEDQADRRALRSLRAMAAAAGQTQIFVRTGDGTLFVLYLRDEPPLPVARALLALGAR
jgi:hypothetical protein